MSKIKDGGLADPGKVWQTDVSGPGWSTASEVNWPGISMRDWFAGQALGSILPASDDVEKRRGVNGVQAKADDYAQIAYVLADAMLRAREGK